MHRPRVASGECTLILAQWNAVEALLEDSRAEPAAKAYASVRGLFRKVRAAYRRPLGSVRFPPKAHARGRRGTACRCCPAPTQSWEPFESLPLSRSSELAVDADNHALAAPWPSALETAARPPARRSSEKRQSTCPANHQRCTTAARVALSMRTRAHRP